MRIAIVVLLMGMTTGAMAAERNEAIFAGGCFWCEEASFEGQPGVIAVVSGYAGGSVKNPTYHQVGEGSTGHAESVKVTFDPTKTSYTKLLDVYWHNVDPFSGDGQFCDRGDQYRPAIFVLDAAQKAVAEASKRAVEKQLGKPVAVEVTLVTEFWPAEDYHQDFYKKNPSRYHSYRLGCGRDKRLKEVWGTQAGSDTH